MKASFEFGGINMLPLKGETLLKLKGGGDQRSRNFVKLFPLFAADLPHVLFSPDVVGEDAGAENAPGSLGYLLIMPLIVVN